MLSPRLIGSCILIIDISCFLYLEFLKEITIFSPPLYCARPWPDFYGNFGKSIHEGHCGLAIFSQKWKHKFFTETTHLGEKNSILQRFRQKSFVRFKRQVKRKLLFSLYVQTIPWDDTCLHRFPCRTLSLVFVMEHNWQILITRVSWAGRSIEGMYHLKELFVRTKKIIISFLLSYFQLEWKTFA